MGDAEYKQRHRDLGQCESCQRPAYPGRRLCLLHLRNHGKSQKKYELKLGDAYYKKHQEIKQHRRDNKLCTSCSAPLADLNYIKCQNCRENIYFRRTENAYFII